MEAKSGYNSMLEADKLEVGAQDEDFFAMLGQLGSNLEAQEAPKAGSELHFRGFRSVLVWVFRVFSRLRAKMEN